MFLSVLESWEVRRSRHLSDGVWWESASWFIGGHPFAVSSLGRRGKSPFYKDYEKLFSRVFNRVCADILRTTPLVYLANSVLRIILNHKQYITICFLVLVAKKRELTNFQDPSLRISASWLANGIMVFGPNAFHTLWISPFPISVILLEKEGKMMTVVAIAFIFWLPLESVVL